MFLSFLSIKNFREVSEEPMEIKFHRGINALIGENDSGKTTIIDAIRLLLGTNDSSYFRITENDFNNGDIQEKTIEISGRFNELTENESKYYLEYLTKDNSSVYLDIHLTAEYLFNKNNTPWRVKTSIEAGPVGFSTPLNFEERCNLNATYLHALRNANDEMKAGKNSRLSNILRSINGIDEGNEYVDKNSNIDNLSLSSIISLMNDLISSNDKIKSVNKEITDTFKNELLLIQEAENKTPQIVVSNNNSTNLQKCFSILEKLSLELSDISPSGEVSLGTSNLLSMACELILIKQHINNDELSSQILLIEEPEAHLHVQRQLKVISSLQKEFIQNDDLQIILSTHSPMLTSEIPLENLIVLKNKNAFSLAFSETKLASKDYKFFSRFLDSTKANLFFAKGVIFVEGASEVLLIPALAKAMNRSLTDYGVTVVNVGGIGFSRYANIFIRENDNELPIDIPVSCVTDLDLIPKSAVTICYSEDVPKYISERVYSDDTVREAKIEKIKKDKGNEQNVRTFVSSYWTLEYDLAVSDLAPYVLKALKNCYTDPIKIAEIESWKNDDKLVCAAKIMRKFINKNISKAIFNQNLGNILELLTEKQAKLINKSAPNYLVDAINYATGYTNGK